MYLYRSNTMSLVTFCKKKYRVFNITKEQFSKLRYIHPGLEMECIMDGVLSSKILSGIEPGKNVHPECGVVDEEELISPLLMRLNRQDYLSVVQNHIKGVYSVDAIFCDADYECLLYEDGDYRFAVPTSLKVLNMLVSKFEVRRGVAKIPKDYPLFYDLSMMLYKKTSRTKPGILGLNPDLFDWSTRNPEISGERFYAPTA